MSENYCIDTALIEEATVLIDLLRTAHLTIVTAESCTGGLIAAALSYAPNASGCLHGGFVVYTKDHKTIALGVSRELLERSGSVNTEVAIELVRGALEHSPADIALSVTGVLGVRSRSAAVLAHRIAASHIVLASARGLSVVPRTTTSKLKRIPG